MKLDYLFSYSLSSFKYNTSYFVFIFLDKALNACLKIKYVSLYLTGDRMSCQHLFFEKI